MAETITQQIQAVTRRRGGGKWLAEKVAGPPLPNQRLERLGGGAGPRGPC